MSNEFDDIDPFAEEDDFAPSSPVVETDDIDIEKPVSKQDIPEPVDDENLTADEKRRALDSWNKGETKLLKIIQDACGSGVTGRHRKGIAIKQYLASLKIKARPSQEYAKKGDSFELKEAHKEFIRAHSSLNKPLQIARDLFGDPKMTNLATEARAVLAFYQTLDPSFRFVKEDDGNDSIGKYTPPRRHNEALARIHRYVFGKGGFDGENLTQKEKHCLDALIKYCNVHRFVYTATELSNQRDRELFESSFIRYVYDKPDVTEEEIDMYINLCSDVVNLTRMQRELEDLIEQRDIIFDDTQKLPMAVVQQITDVRSEMGENQKRQKAVYEALQGKRADRLKNRIAENASVVKLVDLWKSETKRRQLIELAKVRQGKVKATVDRLDSLEALQFQLWGFGKSEAVNY